MAINLQQEKNLVLSAQERYEIIDFATQAAEDNGFMNSFIFERALWLYAAIRLCEDRRDELSSMIAADLLTAWQDLVADGTLEDMCAEFANDLDVLAAEAMTWFEEFTAYAHSARGLLGTIQSLSGDIVAEAASQLKHMQTNGELQQVFNIAREWGLDNHFTESESLFSGE